VTAQDTSCEVRQPRVVLELCRWRGRSEEARTVNRKRAHEVRHRQPGEGSSLLCGDNSDRLTCNQCWCLPQLHLPAAPVALTIAQHLLCEKSCCGSRNKASHEAGAGQSPAPQVHDRLCRVYRCGSCFTSQQCSSCTCSCLELLLLLLLLP
jgi:hypothetical protein